MMHHHSDNKTKHAPRSTATVQCFARQFLSPRFLFLLTVTLPVTAACVASAQDRSDGSGARIGRKTKLQGQKSLPESATHSNERVVIGSLQISAVQGRTWKSTPLDSLLSRFPKGKSLYVVAEFTGRLDGLKNQIRSSGIEIIEELSCGVVIYADQARAKHIAGYRDLGLVDVMQPLTAKAKITPSLQKRIDELTKKPYSGGEVVPRKKDPSRFKKLLERGDVDVIVGEINNPNGIAIPAQQEYIDVVFYIFRNKPLDETLQKVRQAGGTVLGSGSDDTISVIRARVPASRIEAVADAPHVREVIEGATNELQNDVASGILTREPPPFVSAFNGQGQVVAHADTGLDIGENDNTLHVAFRGRLKKVFALGRPSDWSDENGHGTHTAGSILGAGSFPGVAPQALLVHQAVGDSNGGLAGIPTPLGKLFQQAYDEKARIHSNSWGSVRRSPDGSLLNGGDYGSGREVDSWTWNNGQPRDMLVVFSAGNYGSQGTQTVLPPSTAKNCLTVGASENLRPVGGNNGDDIDDLAVFSSQGPTDDGRVRPDVVAPGTWIASPKTQGERIVFEDDVETVADWTADPAFTLSNQNAFHGTQSWRFQRNQGDVFQDFLVSPSVALPQGPSLYAEVWVQGNAPALEMVLVGARTNAANAEVIAVLEQPVLHDWTVISGRIPPDFLGQDTELLFVAIQSVASTAPIELFIDRIEITTFGSWDALSSLDMAAPDDVTDREYTLSGGTSMAAPLVSGCAAVIREALVASGTTNPSAELIKGILINTADVHSGTRPNHLAGWGLVNLRRALEVDQAFDFESTLQDGESITYTLDVDATVTELRTTLVWADPPGPSLVNNLDLMLTSPSNEQIVAVDASGNSPDTTNNVEGIDVASPEAGQWSITIDASAVSIGSVQQPFAVIVSEVR